MIRALINSLRDWRPCGMTATGLNFLEKLPARATALRAATA